MIDPDFFTKLGAAVSITNVETVVVSEAIDVLEAKVAEGRRPFVMYAVEHAQDGFEVIDWTTPSTGSSISASVDISSGVTFTTSDRAGDVGGGAARADCRRLREILGPGSHQDFINLTQALFRTRRLPGSVVEVGCFRGSSGAIMLDYSARKSLPPRRFWFFDVFQGFDYKEALESSDLVWANSHATEGVATVRDALSGRRESTRSRSRN